MLGALSHACPELSSADIHRTSFHNLIGGVDSATGKEFVHYEWSSGGNGAFLEADGPSSMAAIDWGDLRTVQSAEVMETRYPLRVQWTRQAMNSGGAGHTRGGLGTRRALQLTHGQAQYSLLSDGAVVPPFGILGGESAAPVGSYIHEDGKDRPFPTPGKVGGHPMQEGDIIVLQSAGGGGYGDPLTRDPEAVLEDVVEGYVSVEQAKESYGVIVHNGHIDHDATLHQRGQQLDQRHTVRLAGPATGSLYEDIGRGQKRVACLHPDDAAAINVTHDQMMELVGSNGAPIRAWVRIESTARVGHLELDARGYEILRVAPDQEIQIRPLFRPQLS